MNLVLPGRTLKVKQKKELGFTLSELALVFAILGVGAVMVWQVLGLNAADKVRVKSRQALERAAYAIERYAQLNGRLPCPAIDTGGSAHDDGAGKCNFTVTGYVPFVTIGLPLPAAGSIRYEIGVASHALAEPQTARYEVVYAKSTADPTAVKSLLASFPGGSIGIQDFCSDLSKIEDVNGLAFKVGQNPLDFEGTGERPLNIQVSRGQLAGKLACMLVAVGGRSYFNTLSAARMLTKSANDYVTVVETQTGLKGHGIGQAAVSLGEAGWMTGRTVGYIGIAQARYADSLYTDLYAFEKMIEFVAAAGAQGVSTVIQGSDLIRLSTYQAEWNAQVKQLKEIRDRTALLHSQIEKHALDSATGGLLTFSDPK